ncbi:hypothetical protein MLD38_001181 [Melastoma candidum]|uniref:Uncharacterized protein n=1 Tax=Melastoma candidum TaxID=119954 RepID=A0ACB9SDQ6_9MYRT|nr:hypothetical protein MLD38_001181 [Melastoma candidum]
MQENTTWAEPESDKLIMASVNNNYEDAPAQKPPAEKAPKKAVEEAADKAELFAKKGDEKTINSFIPKSESDFLEYAELLPHKLSPFEVYPCPKGSIRHREIVKRLGGKEQFPFLVDPNSGISMYESGDIVKYLYQTYGGGMSPTAGILESTLLTGWMPTILRAGRGMTFWEKAKDLPPEKLELFSLETNPYARIVREALCELELPYILQNAGEGSVREKFLVELSGSKQVPYLVDPNTGAQMGDYQQILSYLFQTYASAA